jgi:hypothetical protein
VGEERETERKSGRGAICFHRQGGFYLIKIIVGFLISSSLKSFFDFLICYAQFG